MEYRELDDLALVLSLRERGDEAALSELIARHKSRVVALCLRVLKDPTEAEDATQEAFAKVWMNIGSLRGDNFQGWLIQIARNHCLNVVSRRREVVALNSGLETASCRHPAEKLSPLAEILMEELGKLPNKQRVCLKLHYLDDYSYVDIAGLTGYTEKEVKSHIQNGKKRLAKTITRRISEQLDRPSMARPAPADSTRIG